MQAPLTALLLCADTQTVGLIDRTFDEYSISAYYCMNSSSAQTSLSQKKFDLLVLDFDDPGAAALIDFRPLDARGFPSVVIALARDPEILKGALSRRVHFVLQKPFAPELIQRTLKAAYGQIVNEKRTAFRHSVRIIADASILDGDTKIILPDATIQDISQTGLCLQVATSVPHDANIFVDFELPDGQGEVHAIGKVMWCDGRGHAGIQFRFIAPLEMKALRTWLISRCPWDVELSPKSQPVFHLSGSSRVQ
jgi:CheY-like chemotaxis protein